MKIIVSGATGFIGRNLINELARNGHEVIALTSNKEAPTVFPEYIHVVLCSMKNYMSLEISELMKEADIFFHLAWAGTSGEKRYDLLLQTENIVATQNAVNLAFKCGCKRFIYAGSIMEFEAIQYIPVDGSEPGRGYIYSTSKIMADYIAKITSLQNKMEYVNLIISNVYGPGEVSKRFINVLLQDMLKNKTIDLTEGKQLYDFIYITDAIRAICEAGLNGKSNCSYYIGNVTPRPLKEFVEMAREVVGGSSKLQYGVISYKGTYLSFSEFDTEKLKNEFKFKPQVDFRDGIKLTVKYLSQRINDEIKG